MTSQTLAYQFPPENEQRDDETSLMMMSSIIARYLMAQPEVACQATPIISLAIYFAVIYLSWSFVTCI